MGVTRAQARSRMGSLMGQGATTPGMTTDQENDLLFEAYSAWKQALPDYPMAFTVTVNANETRADFSLLVTTGTAVPDVYARDVLSVRDTALTGKPLERMTVPEIMQLINDVGATGTPTHCALMQGDVTSVGNTVPEWSLFVYPKPTSNFTASLWCVVYPWKWTADTDVLRLPDDEAYLVARAGAALGAAAMLRSRELVEELWRAIPDRVRAVASTARVSLRAPEVRS